MVSRTKLNEAFRAFRGMGLLARQNFMCCSGCAGSALAQIAEKRVADGKRIEGCVFYHAQDAENIRRNRDLDLRYGDLDTVAAGIIGRPTGEVGRMVVEVLTRLDINHEWDGNPDKTITVKA